jgi:hypothetical protein
MRQSGSFGVLKERLDTFPLGEAADERVEREIADLLADCWHEFYGSRAEGMHAGKLRRLEYLRWDPPVLSFTIERHGGLVMGSTRADLQVWHIDLDRKTAECERGRRYRQLLPRAETVRVEPIAKELAKRIASAKADKRLKWQSADTVRILMSKVFSYESGFKQTISGRRKRLRAKLGPLLAESGWREIRTDVYSKSSLGN